MKLKLTTAGNVQILTITELETHENVEVLRAGITRLFRSGKNHIVLEIHGAAKIPPEFLRELGKLRLLAHELSGDVVLAALDPIIRQQVETFAKPPVMVLFATRELAIQHFNPPAKAPVRPTATPAVAGAQPVSTEIQELREQIRNREMGELGTLRKEVEKLRAENQALSTLLAQRIQERRELPDVEAYKEKIEKLEAELASLLETPPASPQ